ncbi:4Fe-4S dicluster domain-containing protein [Desulfacinum hydrothermale DSM 13146]|uniref:4Fe-4S dicluster domain-containing protein n=1 Tax=Desulfacinum hydrothermale DSM 13146 TaxID=1121390 RepID=A0A1W1X020_9BACT|nr:4Fe-4S dicluster domain-containing protein [Desulfacinum hydrothermale]SMC17322.1 4Fe-4S dicluster domain-containing protein [Desulfacinum hydrothermale DSM 13146]
MEKAVFLPDTELHEALAALSADAQVWVPAGDASKPDLVRFQRYRPGLSVRLDARSLVSAKEVLFPRSEALLRFVKEKDLSVPAGHRLHVDDTRTVPPAVVFGCRPCDARGFLTFDRVFLQGPYRDPYYAERREKTTFVSLVCRDADGACFCSAVGSGPADPQGSDAQLIALPDGYVLRAITQRGAALVEKIGRGPTAEQIQAARDMLDQAGREMVGEGSLTAMDAAFRARFQDAAFWHGHIDKCLSCGLCTFVCPTCYCFTITDEARGLSGERIRSWDACMFPHFTLEASGHNPRPSKVERYRNRVGHKFSYFVSKYGQVACCGCGRCIRHCPVSVDIRAVVRDLPVQEEVHA